jgi:hypothetical protein
MGIFILQNPARSLAEPKIFFSLSHEARDKTCRRPFFGQLTLVGDTPQGKPNLCCAPLKGPFICKGHLWAKARVFPQFDMVRGPQPGAASALKAIEIDPVL